MLCQFLLFSKVTQLYMLLYPLFLDSLPIYVITEYCVFWDVQPYPCLLYTWYQQPSPSLSPNTMIKTICRHHQRSCGGKSSSAENYHVEHNKRKLGYSSNKAKPLYCLKCMRIQSSFSCHPILSMKVALLFPMKCQLEFLSNIK